MRGRGIWRASASRRTSEAKRERERERERDSAERVAWLTEQTSMRAVPCALMPSRKTSSFREERATPAPRGRTKISIDMKTCPGARSTRRTHSVYEQYSRPSGLGSPSRPCFCILCGAACTSSTTTSLCAERFTFDSASCPACYRLHTGPVRSGTLYSVHGPLHMTVGGAAERSAVPLLLEWARSHRVVLKSIVASCCCVHSFRTRSAILLESCPDDLAAR